MHRIAITLLITLAYGSIAFAQDKPQVLMKTTMGDLKIELYPKEAPISTENFLAYVKSGYFDGTIFHRVISTFVIQGGGFNKEMKKKQTKDPIKNEANNGLKNLKYTLSMARTGDPNSATSQFFINLKDNAPLDRGFPGGDGNGYAVFGKVIEGQEVVEKIKNVKTTSVGAGFQRYEDVPVEPIIVTGAKILEKK